MRLPKRRLQQTQHRSTKKAATKNKAQGLDVHGHQGGADESTLPSGMDTLPDDFVAGHSMTTEEATPVRTGSSLKGGSVMGTRLGNSEIAPAFGSAAFNKLLDETTGSVVAPNNKADLLFDGVNSFAERRRLIEGAKTSIHLQTFIFTDDETGWDTAKLLAQKADEGVQVRVIYDALGSNRSDKKMFDFMRAHGVEVRAHGPLGDVIHINQRWHEKALIVDGQTAIMGGMNIADEYAFGGSGRMIVQPGRKSSEAWRDVDMKIEGPAVFGAQAGFLVNWSQLGDEVKDTSGLFPTCTLSTRTEAGEGQGVRYIQHHPHGKPPDKHTKALYLAAIRSSQKSITIENAYFLPSKEIRQELIAAAERGVDVRIITNSRESNDITAVSDCSHYFYRQLLEAGVHIFEKHGGTLHAKTATFDGEFSIVGSCNLNGRSEGCDSENVLATEDAHTAQQLEERFIDGLDHANPFTLEDLDNEGVLRHLKEMALSPLAWTF